MSSSCTATIGAFIFELGGILLPITDYSNYIIEFVSVLMQLVSNWINENPLTEPIPSQEIAELLIV